MSDYFLQLREDGLSKLAPAVAEYVERAAETGRSKSANYSAFKKWKTRRSPNSTDAEIDSTIVISGQRYLMPIAISPTAWHQLYTPTAELAVSDAAKTAGVIMINSCFSNLEYSKLRGEGSANRLTYIWQQFLVHKDEGVMLRCFDSAAEAGCAVLVLTVDAPSGCRMCKSAEAKNSLPIGYPPSALPLLPKFDRYNGATLDEYYADNLDPSALSWNRLSSLIKKAPLPVILKGVMEEDEAIEAKNSGAAGIIVSNHGGRQRDDGVSTLDALCSIVSKIGRSKPEFEIFLDGGVTCGADVFKACALGARAALIGRLAIYAIAIDGARGLEKLLSRLRSELIEEMKRSGSITLEQIRADYIELTSG